jgi:hypothetical protein
MKTSCIAEACSGLEKMKIGHKSSSKEAVDRSMLYRIHISIDMLDYVCSVHRIVFIMLLWKWRLTKEKRYDRFLWKSGFSCRELIVITTEILVSMLIVQEFYNSLSSASCTAASSSGEIFSLQL